MPTVEELIKKLNEINQNTPETRSRRVQVLMTPSMYDALRALSDAGDEHVSVNEIINLALSEFLKGKE